jgi:hypothetical protein
MSAMRISALKSNVHTWREIRAFMASGTFGPVDSGQNGASVSLIEAPLLVGGRHASSQPFSSAPAAT